MFGLPTSRLQLPHFLNCMDDLYQELDACHTRIGTGIVKNAAINLKPGKRLETVDVTICSMHAHPSRKRKSCI